MGFTVSVCTSGEQYLPAGRAGGRACGREGVGVGVGACLERRLASGEVWLGFWVWGLGFRV